LSSVLIISHHFFTFLAFVQFQMDADSPRISAQLPRSPAHGRMDSGLVVDRSVQPAACTLCRRILSPENEASGDLETIGLCGDCKFLFFEDHGTPMPDSYQYRTPRGRRTRYSSSESVENLFSQEFSHMINLARQNQSTAGYEDQPLDGDAMTMLLQHSSSRSTPSGSRRWRRVLSDTDSDGFDHMDSFYGESESNVSFGQYEVFHGESDAISFSAYGGDSDVSVEGHSFLDPEMFVQLDEGSIFDSDTDIDPMHAGLNQWDSEEEEEDGEWEEADAEEDVVESVEAGGRLQNFLSSDDTISWGLREGRQTFFHTIFANLEEVELLPHVRNSGDYLDARGFEELLARLAETDSSRRGAPPAAMSFVNSLPHVVINEQHEKHEGLACAICKEMLPIGTEVNQLPCFHLYHPSCILPWLSTRNSCPLCRYELPTDDKDYEEGKLNHNGIMEIHEIQLENVSEDSSSDVFDGAGADEECEFNQGRIEQRGLLDVDPPTNISGREGGRGRWLFLAAAPIVGLMGIMLVWWLGNPLIQGRGPTSQCSFTEQGHSQSISTPSPSQRENRSRRWWSLF
jgi:hypothetical protein